jgi:glutathionylspermidine synthase
MRQSIEDKVTVDYLRDTAIQAGLDVSYIAIEDIGWNGHAFTDLDEKHIDAVFKLYPWDWLMRDPFGHYVMGATTRWIEPAWRLLLSGKGLLALLWEMFPDHPNLLPAYREPGLTGGPEIRKPLFGREGANIAAPNHATTGPYGDGGYVYQRYQELPCLDGRYAVLGSWVIGGRAVGVGIREDMTPITQNTSRFVPHYFADDVLAGKHVGRE